MSSLRKRPNLTHAPDITATKKTRDIKLKLCSLPDTALCAGAEGRDACDVSQDFSLLKGVLVTLKTLFQGDGGGPLVCESEGQWYQVFLHPLELFLALFSA